VLRAVSPASRKAVVKKIGPEEQEAGLAIALFTPTLRPVDVA
jgi:hypothetical protein